MTDRSSTSAADDFVLARQSVAERDAAFERVRAYFADDAPLLGVDVRTLLADHARARSLVTQLQQSLRGEKHHHENDVQRLTAERDALQARIDAAHALTEPHPLRHWDTQWPIRAALEGMTAAEYAGEQDTRTALSGPTAQGIPAESESTVDDQSAKPKPRCCIGPFADGTHAVGCLQACQDCSGDEAGPRRCRCNDDGRLHTLALSCWCEPTTALDGHVNEDGSAPEFAATDLDPVDPDGFLVEELAR